MAISYNSSFPSAGLVTLYDAANSKSFDIIENLFPNSERLNVATPSVNIIDYSTFTGYTYDMANTGGPYGGTYARLTLTDASVYVFDWNNSVTLAAGDTVTQSWHLRLVTPITNTEQYTVRFWTGTGRAWLADHNAAFWASNNTLYYTSGNTSPISTTIEPIGSGGWVRLSLTAKAQQAGYSGMSIVIDSAAAGTIVDVAAPSLVKNGMPMPYTPTTTTAIARQTTWTDVVGGQNLTIMGSPTINPNGYFTFGPDQITQYMVREGYNMPPDYHTMTYWFRPSTASASPLTQTPLTYAAAGNSNYWLHIMADSATKFRVYNRSGLYNDYTVPSMTNRWNCFSRTRVMSTGVERYYMNGSYIGTVTASVGSGTTSNGILVIGQEMDSVTAPYSFSTAQNLDGDFSFLSLHNVAFTDEQIMNNFNAMRGRYGV